MAFPRRFKKELWYLRLPSGEVDIATATGLQRAFECGLVDLRTPVRAFGANVWTTMREAAELSIPPGSSIASLIPTSFDAPVAVDLVDGTPWQSRRDVDPKAFKPSRLPVLLGAVLTVAFAGVAFFEGDAIKAASASDIEPAKVVNTVTHGSRREIREQLHTPNRPPGPRFTKDQRHRLAELDYITRTQRPKTSIVKPLVVKPGPARSEDPFQSGTRAPLRGDPLDGSI